MPLPYQTALGGPLWILGIGHFPRRTRLALRPRRPLIPRQRLTPLHGWMQLGRPLALGWTPDLKLQKVAIHGLDYHRLLSLLL